jgi:hypothetical protein
MLITNQQLRDAYLSPAMEHYFRKKLPDLPGTELAIRIEETIKFLAMAPHCSGPIPVSREIDEIWHLWILETKEYQVLCACLQTGEFIHHTSMDYLKYFDDGAGTDTNLLESVRVLATYVANYGPIEEHRIRYWLLASYLCERRNWRVQELNDWLASSAESKPAALGIAAPSAEAAVG